MKVFFAKNRSFKIIINFSNGYIEEVEHRIGFYYQFTSEIETNSMLNFLDITIAKINSQVIHKIYNPKPKCLSAEKKPVYFHLPFLWNASLEIKRKLTISRFYLTFSLDLSSLLNLLRHLSSDLKIEFLIICFHLLFTNTIADSVRPAIIGQTRKQLKIRMSQHKGRSFRTGQLLASPEFSNIRNHAFESDHPILDDNFIIIDTCDSFDLRLLESIYIHKKKPYLNDQNSSTELSILCWIQTSVSNLARPYISGKFEIDRCI